MYMFAFFRKKRLCVVSKFWGKLHFQKLLQSSVSHDPKEIILIRQFGAPEIFLIIISVENSFAA